MSRLKIESARRQLGTALALYLQDRDPVSVHCLAGGGCELLDFYAKKAGGIPFTSHILKTTPDLDVGKLYRLQRQYWNAFKHATHSRSGDEREDDDLLLSFSDLQNDTALFVGWWDYAQVMGMMPIEAQAQQAWYIALNPDKLSPEHSLEPYETVFPQVREKPRAEQKQMLRQAIERYRGIKAVVSDPKTETRALVLSWSVA